jgi:hypothetical protein
MVEIILQILFEFLGELLLMFGIESVVAPFEPAKDGNRFMAFAGLFILAVATSLVASLFIPTRLLPPTRFVGASLVISPLFVGSAMHLFGNWRQERGKPRTHLASFWGGAFYSFVFASTRLVFLQFSTPAA